jgi:hypothetical protein
MSFIDGDFKDSMQASEFCGCLVLADYGDLADELLNLSMFSFLIVQNGSKWSICIHMFVGEFIGSSDFYW